MLTEDQLAKLSPAARRKLAEIYTRKLDQYENQLIEEDLTPRIPFKVCPPEPTPTQPDLESSLIEFFRTHPEIDEVKVGSVLYRR